MRLAEDVDRVLDAAQGLARQARSMHASERLEAARRETADLSVELAAFVDRVSDVVVSCQAVHRVVCHAGNQKDQPLFARSSPSTRFLLPLQAIDRGAGGRLALASPVEVLEGTSDV